MRFALTMQQFSCFSKYQALELEGLLSVKEAKYARVKAEQYFLEALSLPSDQLIFSSFQERYKLGRDVFRRCPFFKKLALRWNFAQLTSELTHKKPIRLVADQLIYTGEGKNNASAKESIQKSFCFQGIYCALLLRLTFSKKEPASLAVEKDPLVPLPAAQGNGLWLSVEKSLNWKEAFSLPSQWYYLILYGGMDTVYTFNEKDPCTHSLKSLGYNFGDTLRTEHHPILY